MARPTRPPSRTESISGKPRPPNSESPRLTARTGCRIGRFVQSRRPTASEIVRACTPSIMRKPDDGHHRRISNFLRTLYRLRMGDGNHRGHSCPRLAYVGRRGLSLRDSGDQGLSGRPAAIARLHQALRRFPAGVLLCDRLDHRPGHLVRHHGGEPARRQRPHSQFRLGLGDRMDLFHGRGDRRLCARLSDRQDRPAHASEIDMVFRARLLGDDAADRRHPVLHDVAGKRGLVRDRLDQRRLLQSQFLRAPRNPHRLDAGDGRRRRLHRRDGHEGRRISKCRSCACWRRSASSAASSP